jgi:ankyrin repeat protein
MGDLQLIKAVKDGDMATVKEMIKSGVDINQQDDNGWTPLNWAAGNGDIDTVKLLVENGADVFKVGRDQRTPYMIALAASRVEVVKFLREAEENYVGEKRQLTPRPYCKAYHLSDMRQFPGWTESQINWKESNQGGRKNSGAALEDGDSQYEIAFIHDDLTVTQSMWRAENVIFNQISPEWEEFCKNILNFRVPDDLEFILPDNPNS